MRREVLEVKGDGVRFTLDNRSGWASRDLAKFFHRGLVAFKAKTPKHIIVTPSPIRSRGCAQIGQGGKEAEAIVIAIASPSHFDLRRLARLFEHEFAHTKGQYHEDMSHNVMWSLGPVPRWAKVTIRWQGDKQLSRKRRRRSD